MCCKDKYIIVEHSFNVEDWMIRDDGSLIFLEEEIHRESKVKIFVNPNELTHHHRPHVHVLYEDKEYSISIDSSFDLLGNAREDKYFNFIKRTYFRSDYWIQKFRKAWNEKTKSLLQFKKLDNTYLNETENRNA